MIAVARDGVDPSELLLDAPEDELVRRFQGVVRPYAGRLYALLSVVLALIAGFINAWLIAKAGGAGVAPEPKATVKKAKGRRKR